MKLYSNNDMNPNIMRRSDRIVMTRWLDKKSKFLSLLTHPPPGCAKTAFIYTPKIVCVEHF